jgi:nitrite reductase/ring-hydroxylating ferredoxin subunit
MSLEAIIPADAPLDGDGTAPWRRGWFYAGPAEAVAEDGCHLTVDLPRLSITVQNFAGTLAGFLNVCSHRATKMRRCGRGRGVLRCPYHGWTYNRDGVPVGIPDNETLFRFSPEEKRDLALTRVAVAIHGPLLFLNLAGDMSDPAASIRLPQTLADRPELRVVAERTETVERPWDDVVAGWATAGVALVPPGLVIGQAEDWVLLRHVLPLTESVSQVGYAAFHAGLADVAAMPAVLGKLWPAEAGVPDHAPDHAPG